MSDPFGELELNYKDHCLILVGDGGAADERLARRRLAAGGRLAHFLVTEEQVKHAGAEDEIIFTWQPLHKATTSSLGRKLGPSMKTYWTKSGPDCIALAPGQCLEIFTQNGEMRLVRLVNELTGHVLMELSGLVLLHVTPEEAETVDVEVEDPELRACGTFSKRYVLISLLVLCLWHLLRWVVSMKFELVASEGQWDWWRGVLVIVSGFFCAPGLWHGWAASLSGEADCGWTHKLVSLLVISLVAMLAARAQVADFPLYGISTIASFLSGPLLQYYQTRWSHPSRHLFDCLLWTLAQLVGTIGLAAVLSVIVVLYRTLLEPEMFANVFLPVSTAVVEGGMVSFTQMMYTTLVVKRRPAVPGDVSFVAMPYMLTCLHGFAEAARIVGVFSGAVTGGEYTWLGSLGVGLLLNVLARCGWTRLGLYMVLKQLLPLRWALVFAPGAYGKLHDEIKIYAGYFRFPVVISLVIARAIVHQDLSLDGPKSFCFNASAALSLLCMLLMEILEDQIVLRQLVPMSPVLQEFVDSEVQKEGHGRHGSLLSLDLRRTTSLSPWRLEELDEKGFKSSANSPRGTSPRGMEGSPTQPSAHSAQSTNDPSGSGPTVTCLSLPGEAPRTPEKCSPEAPSPQLLPVLPGSEPAPPPPPLARAASTDSGVKRPILRMPSEPAPSQSGHLPGLFAVTPSSESSQRPARAVRSATLTVPSRQISKQSVGSKRSVGSKQSVGSILSHSQSEAPDSPRLVPSLGQRRDSLGSRIRSSLGQPRAITPSLLLHGLREMPLWCQLSAIGIISEATLGFLNTTMGPGGGIINEPCPEFDALVSLWWPCPLQC
ncbi:unnamed protein product [Durusdinium trenchii]|uniref:Pecanex-like protein n=1 Tax=Durusdinium trenchii TaxID=1381693 RepID=A0ABP0LVK4_9DINO